MVTFLSLIGLELVSWKLRLQSFYGGSIVGHEPYFIRSPGGTRFAPWGRTWDALLQVKHYKKSCFVFFVESRHMLVRLLPNIRSLGCGGIFSEVIGSDHHWSGTQGVAGASEVVPLNTIELPDVVPNCVVYPIKVGEATGIKPPTCMEKEHDDKENWAQRERRKIFAKILILMA